MANFEEKILAYLDGSLSEADRADVLAKISGEHGSERALFDEHLRLQDLYSAVRKPVSAPLALQQELASRIPVLAVKLPFLAMPGERRNRFAAGWLGTLRSSWVNVALLFAALLLIGGVWYAAKTNSQHISASVTNVTANRSSNSYSLNATSRNASPNVAPSNVASLNSNAANSNAANSNAANASTAHSNPSPTNASYPNANRSYTSHSTILHSNRSDIGHAGGMSSARSSDVRNASANRSNNRLANAKGTSTTEGSQKNSSIGSLNVNSPVVDNQAKPADPNLADLPPLLLHSLDIDSVEPVSFHPQRIASIIYPDEENSSNSVPFHVYALGGSRYLMPFSKPSPYVTEAKLGIVNNGIVPSTEAGAEYEITPWTSAGVRVGWTSFAQYQSFTHNSSSILYSQYSDDSVRSVPSLWCALAITQTFNPFDKTQFSLSLAGGPAFVQPVAWLGMIEANISYDLSQTFMLRLGASYDIEQVKQSTAGISSEPSSTAGFITSSTGGALTSNAFGLNIGITFHP